MQAVMLNCSLKASAEESNTQLLANVVIEALAANDVRTEVFRLADLNIPPGVATDLGEGDDWPRVHDAILGADILVFATPTWVGRPPSLAQRALERMDAMLSETDGDDRPVAYNRVAGVVVTGNEDGAHHVISEISGGPTGTAGPAPGRRTATPTKAISGPSRPARPWPPTSSPSPLP